MVEISSDSQKSSIPQRSTAIEGSSRYYQTREMHTFAAISVVYNYVMDRIATHINTDFRQILPTEISILGGFFSDKKNIEEFNKLSKRNAFADKQLRYLDLNSEPAKILSPEEKELFYQVNLKDIATKKGEDSEPIVQPETVKMIVLDHVTEFMDDDTLKEFFDALTTVLSKDGVALMAVVKVKVKLFHKIMSKFKMGVQTYPRTPEEWQNLAEEKLKISLQLMYPIDSRDGILFVLSRKDSPYPSDTTSYEVGNSDLRSYSLKLYNESQ